MIANFICPVQYHHCGDFGKFSGNKKIEEDSGLTTQIDFYSIMNFISK